MCVLNVFSVHSHIMIASVSQIQLKLVQLHKVSTQYFMQVGKKKVLALLLNLQYIQLLPILYHNLHSHVLIATSTLALVSLVSAACILAPPVN